MIEREESVRDREIEIESERREMRDANRMTTEKRFPANWPRKIRSCWKEKLPSCIVGDVLLIARRSSGERGE